MSRAQREQRTIALMVALYCRHHHRSLHAGEAPPEAAAVQPRPPDLGLCEECARLLAYADRRLDRCRFGEEKPTCARCMVHCFAAEPREQIRVVMRYAGPRMSFRHPLLATAHLLNRRG